MTAVELDRAWPAISRALRGARRGSARPGRGDVARRAADRPRGSAPWALVANVPYHITSPILHHVLGGEPRPERFVLMVQREVAERIAAPPGGMSYLSVFVQYHADVRVAFVVPAHRLRARAGGRSAVLVGETRPRRLDDGGGGAAVALVQAGFRERRKMLHNVLPRQLPRSAASASTRPWRESPSRRTGGPRRSASTSGWRSPLPCGPREARCG